jgi:hypothetical protein
MCQDFLIHADARLSAGVHRRKKTCKARTLQVFDLEAW